MVRSEMFLLKEDSRPKIRIRRLSHIAPPVRHSLKKQTRRFAPIAFSLTGIGVRLVVERAFGFSGKGSNQGADTSGRTRQST